MDDEELMKLAVLRNAANGAQCYERAYKRLAVQAHHAAVMAKADIRFLREVLGLPVKTEAIAALDALILTPPVPVDPDIQIVRDILHAHQRAMTQPDSGWGNMSYAKGSYDHLPVFQAALAAYKATRQNGEAQ